MQCLYVAIVFLAKDGTYLLQLRDADPRKGAAGLIGGFGGKIESGETALAAAHRELQEETSLRIDAERLKEMGMVTAVSDYKRKPVEVHITAFLLPLHSGETVTATEGSIVELSRAEALAQATTLTPGTHACFEIVIKE